MLMTSFLVHSLASRSFSNQTHKFIIHLVHKLRSYQRQGTHQFNYIKIYASKYPPGGRGCQSKTCRRPNPFANLTKM